MIRTGRPSQFVPLPQRLLSATAAAPSANYSEEISGGFFSRLALLIEGTVTNSGNTTTSGEGIANVLGDVRITQNGSPYFTALGPDLRLLTSLFGNKLPDVNHTGTTTGAARCAIDLDFGRMMPGAGFDASGKNRFGLRIDTRVPTAATPLATAYALNMRAQAEHYGGQVPDASEILLPRWQVDIIDMSAERSANTVRKTFDRDGVLLACAIRTLDAGATRAADARSDAMVRRAKLKLAPASGGYEELFDQSWGQLRQNTAKEFKVPEAQDYVGFGVHRFVDPRARAANFGLTLQANDSLELALDNLTTIEAMFGTAVTPAANDVAIVTWLWFEGSPSGLRGPQSGTNPAARAAVGSRSGRTRR